MFESNWLIVQTTVLIRYDITLALVNKKGCRIPLVYLDALAKCGHEPWQFFALTGCFPQHLLIAYRMCELVARKGYETSIEVRQEALSLEEEILKLECEPHNTYQHASITNHGQEPNAFAGFAIWSNALQYFSRRILRRMASSHPLVTEPGRMVLTHAEGGLLYDRAPLKQYLLPILLVAADAKTDEQRNVARKYIFRWCPRLSVPHWSEASMLLNGVWQAHSERPEEDISFVDFCAGTDYMFV